MTAYVLLVCFALLAGSASGQCSTTVTSGTATLTCDGNGMTTISGASTCLSSHQVNVLAFPTSGFASYNSIDGTACNLLGCDQYTISFVDVPAGNNNGDCSSFAREVSSSACTAATPCSGSNTFTGIPSGRKPAIRIRCTNFINTCQFLASSSLSVSWNTNAPSTTTSAGQTTTTPAGQTTTPAATQGGQTTTPAPCTSTCCIDADQRGMTCKGLGLSVPLVGSVNSLQLRWNRCASPETIDFTVGYIFPAGSAPKSTTKSVAVTDLANVPIVPGVALGLTNVRTTPSSFTATISVILGISPATTTFSLPNGLSTFTLGDSTKSACSLPAAFQCPDECGKCFHQDTLITYKERSHLSIADLEQHPECRIPHRVRADGVRIETSGGHVLRLTDDHLVFTAARGLIAAAQVSIGDMLFTTMDATATTTVTRIAPEFNQMYCCCPLVSG